MGSLTSPPADMARELLDLDPDCEYQYSEAVTLAARVEAAMEIRGWRCRAVVSPHRTCHLWLTRSTPSDQWQSTDCHTYRMGSAESRAAAVIHASLQALDMAAE